MSLSRPAVFQAALAVTVSVGCALMTPVLLGRTLNALVVASRGPGHAAAQRFLRSLLLVFALFLVECAAGMAYVAKMTAIADRAVLQLRTDAFGSVAAGCDASFFDKVPAAEISNAVGNDSSRVRDLCWQSLQTDRGVRALAEATLGVCVVMCIAPQIAAIYLVCIPIVASVSALSGLRMASLFGREAIARNKATALARESLGQWKLVLSFGAGERELAKYASRLRKVDSDVSAQLRPRKAFNDFLSRFGVVFILCAVLSIGGGMVAYGALPLETYLSTQSFLWKLTFATQGVIYTTADMSEAATALRRVYSVIDRATDASRRMAETSAKSARPSMDAVRGQLSLRDVTFAYPLRPDTNVFSGLSLDLAAGRTTALVGPSGAGKSSVAALLSRFYEPQGGSILLDGVDIASLDRAWYAERIAVVQQSPVVFSGSVRDAIAYGAPDRSRPVPDAVVVAAAKLANAHDFITELPAGYDTEVGVGGSSFSGGQLQRIAIARAIVRDPKILLLDEATSALDAESELKVQQALDRLTKGKTCLVVAHRLSTIRNADKVVVLGGGGRVVESGSYDELVGRGGAFARLVSQTETFMAE